MDVPPAPVLGESGRRCGKTEDGRGKRGRPQERFGDYHDFLPET
jgi:hypothetical protein